ncbi:hypothetical protein AAG906_025404 [Vitis piasezkii]
MTYILVASEKPREVTEVPKEVESLLARFEGSALQELLAGSILNHGNLLSNLHGELCKNHQSSSSFFSSSNLVQVGQQKLSDDEHQQLANPKFQDCMGTTGPTHHVMDPCIHIRCSSNTFGLPQEYETFIISVSSRINPYTVEGIEALLLAHETHIEESIKIHEFSSQFSSLGHVQWSLQLQAKT